MKTNPNDLAIPTNQVVNDIDGNFMSTISHAGLTKRELFVAMAMQGFLAEGAVMRGNLREIAESSVMASDALIEALNKGKEDAP